MQVGGYCDWSMGRVEQIVEEAKDGYVVRGLGEGIKMDGYWKHFSPTLLIFGHLVWREMGRSEDLLMGLLLGLAKLVINRSRQRAVEGVMTANCLPLFRSYFRAWVSLECEHTVSIKTLNAFRESEQWYGEKMEGDKEYGGCELC
eukprot:g42114.t1